jgi:hypothetical protein
VGLANTSVTMEVSGAAERIPVHPHISVLLTSSPSQYQWSGVCPDYRTNRV